MTVWQRRKIFISTTWNYGCSSIKRFFQNKVCWEISNNHFPFCKIYLAATRQTSIINKWESVGFIVQSNDDITIGGNPDTWEVFRYNVIFHITIIFNKYKQDWSLSDQSDIAHGVSFNQADYLWMIMYSTWRNQRTHQSKKVFAGQLTRPRV